MLKTIIIIGICVIFSVSATRDKRQAQQCYTPDNYLGVCAKLSNCQYLRNLYAQSGNSRQTINFLNNAQKNCGNRNIQGDPVVCCAQSNQNRQGSIEPKITSSNKKSKKCTGPDGVAGVCKALSRCSRLSNRLERNPQDSAFKNFLRLSNEVCRAPAPTICCPTRKRTKSSSAKPTLGSTANVNTIPTLGEGCGLSKNTFQKVVGGEPAKLGAWPWIALIGYRDSFGTDSFKCGGALITQRHVITAAHCIRTDLKFVRLGEHDLNFDSETNHVDVNVVKSKRHPSYSSKDGHSDIAVLRLERGAPFTDLIRPGCLPNTPELRSKSYVSYLPFVAGWGKTEEAGRSSQVLQEIQIPVHANTVCKDSYKKINHLLSAQQFDNAVICAGVLAGGKDTCQGDSGGPLMVPEQFEKGIRFYIIGIVSYSIGCARPNIPGVYTNVAHFMDWILQQVADNS